MGEFGGPNLCKGKKDGSSISDSSKNGVWSLRGTKYEL